MPVSPLYYEPSINRYSHIYRETAQTKPTDAQGAIYIYIYLSIYLPLSIVYEEMYIYIYLPICLSIYLYLSYTTDLQPVIRVKD